MSATAVTARFRCRACSTTELVSIERQGGAVIVPARVVHVKCGNVMRPMSAEMKRFLGETKDDL